jgi:hypothetical protein
MYIDGINIAMIVHIYILFVQVLTGCSGQQLFDDKVLPTAACHGLTAGGQQVGRRGWARRANMGAFGPNGSKNTRLCQVCGPSQFRAIAKAIHLQPQ